MADSPASTELDESSPTELEESSESEYEAEYNDYFERGVNKVACSMPPAKKLKTTSISPAVGEYIPEPVDPRLANYCYPRPKTCVDPRLPMPYEMLEGGRDPSIMEFVWRGFSHEAKVTDSL